MTLTVPGLDTGARARVAGLPPGARAPCIGAGVSGSVAARPARSPRGLAARSPRGLAARRARATGRAAATGDRAAFAAPPAPRILAEGVRAPGAAAGATAAVTTAGRQRERHGRARDPSCAMRSGPNPHHWISSASR